MLAKNVCVYFYKHAVQKFKSFMSIGIFSSKNVSKSIISLYLARYKAASGQSNGEIYIRKVNLFLDLNFIRFC